MFILVPGKTKPVETEKADGFDQELESNECVLLSITTEFM